ncbi:MAG: hypothetical protein J6Z45_02090 [Oscillospiraceae bacterium]|nr:hypothetical protein [Oscillospiraceae bacterium]
MIKKIDTRNDDRTLLEYVRQVVIPSGVTNLIVNYFFYSEINDPDAEPCKQFSYSGKPEQFEKAIRPYAFIYEFRMNQQIQRVEYDSDRDDCYIEIWV